MKMKKNHHEIVLVMAAIIKKKNRILISQRKKNSKFEPDRWEFPGGKLKNNENLTDGLYREIKEELEIEINIKKLYMVTSHTYYKDNLTRQVILVFYLAEWIKGKEKNAK